MILSIHSSERMARRPGAIVPLVAISMPVFLALVAFMVDTGNIVVTMTELQNAADSSALAGASQLQIPVISSSLQATLAPTAVANAKQMAQQYCLLNSAGGVNLQLADSDIVVGYQASAGDAVVPYASGQPFPNAVQVTVRRDTTTNNPLSLFFGPAIGTSTWSGSASATAANLTTRYDITGFNTTTNSPNPLLLPIGLDLNYLQNFLATGQSPDGIVHDDYTAVAPSTNNLPPLNVTKGADNIPELYGTYPDTTSPGNFGLVNLNYTNPVNNDPQFASWIVYGPTPSDIASFGTNGFQATSSSPTVVKGGPGLKSNLVSDLNSIIGEPRILPVFSSYSGQGSNTSYTIVGFMGVTVVQASGHGSNETITFQPMQVTDPTATRVITTSSSSTNSQFVYSTSPLVLTR